jgi:transposase
MTKARNLRRKFDSEFKREAVRLWEARRKAGVPIGRVAKELGLRANQLREWTEQVTAETSGAVARLGETEAQELRRLRRENARLQQEVEFAKKAAAFFIRESR